MGLWLEHRDDSGKLLDRERFSNDLVIVSLAAEPFALTATEARVLSRASVHLPIEKREWALRIGFDDIED